MSGGSEEQETLDRRPIAARQTRWAQSLAHRLAMAGVSPNAISVAGMIAGVLAGVVLACTTLVLMPAQRAVWVVAAVLVQLRLLANMFDGMVAIETNRASPVGELYNEIPDRVSDAATLIGLGYAVGGSVTLGYVAACLAIFTAYVRAQGKAAGAASEFCGPMAKQQRMFIVTAVALFMAIAPQLWRFIGRGSGIPTIALAVISIGCVITALRRLVRIGNHLRGSAT